MTGATEILTEERITNGGLIGNIPDSSTDYFYNDSWQCMEERIASTAPAVRQYVWGNYIDECIQLTTFSVLGPQNLPAEVYYPLQDLLYRTVALTNGIGGIVEAYDTDAYGNTIIFTAADSGGNWFSAGATQSDYGANEIIFCGYRYDPETQAYYVRNRTYSPWLGRWLQRDPIWYGDGWNAYEYCGGRVVGRLDGTGLSWSDIGLAIWNSLGYVVTGSEIPAAAFGAPAAAKILIINKFKRACRKCMQDALNNGNPCAPCPICNDAEKVKAAP
jgi:RHS repeat-associated protein